MLHDARAPSTLRLNDNHSPAQPTTRNARLETTLAKFGMPRKERRSANPGYPRSHASNGGGTHMTAANDPTTSRTSSASRHDAHHSRSRASASLDLRQVSLRQEPASCVDSHWPSIPASRG